MKAIGYVNNTNTAEDNGLVVFETHEPELGPRDLLIAIQGVSVNPVDVKVKSNTSGTETPKILGFDAAGTVLKVGAAVEYFNVGDEVFYAGALMRAGSNAEQQAVDERIVGKKPKTLSFADAASLPLTSITAWEILFDSFSLVEGEGAGVSILVLGAAGGVGSILMQLVKRLTGLTVIATASRPETRDWAMKMGADHVINHHQDLAPQLKKLGLVPKYVASLTATDQHFDAIVGLIAPRGQIAIIDEPKPLNINSMKQKALSLHWEFMFSRSLFGTDDLITQQQLLNRVSDMVDEGLLYHTATRHLGPLTPETLEQAHQTQSSGRMLGKQVFEAMSDLV